MASTTATPMPRPAAAAAVSTPKRAGSIFEGQNRSKEYWNNLLCVLTGLNPDASKPAGATSICNRDYFNDQPSPPRTPILRTRSSTNSVAGSTRTSFLRPSFTSRRSSRSILRRISTRGSGIDYEIQEEPVLAELTPQTSPIEPVLEDVPSSSFEDSLLSTVPGATAQQEEMISLEHEGRTIWLPRHVLTQYSSAPQQSLQRPGSAGRLTISIPDRTTSKPIKHVSDEGQALTLVETTRSAAPSEKSFTSSSPSSSHRSKNSISGSSIDSPSLDTPGSVYSSDGTSLTSLELQTPVDSLAPHAGHSKNYSVADPLKAGVFDDASSPPPVMPRNPRRTSARLPLPSFDGKEFVARSPAASELFIVDSDAPDMVKRVTENTPPVPQRSRRRPEKAAPPPQSKLAKSRSMGDMSLAVVREQPSAADGYVTSDAAENVIFHILLAAQSLPDLFALASINSGFRAVYKRYQLALVKSTLRTACVAAWELREASDEDAPSDPSQPERARAYLHALRRDVEALDDLKSAILTHCASFLRPSTLAALRGQDPAAATAVDAALWRIWTFCTLFAPAPSAVDAQAAWLRSPARGAGARLAAAHLYDMTELWNCIGALLANAVLGCEAALERARAAGVVGPAADDAALEAWLDAQRARGPAVALELAAVAAEPAADVFAFAAQMGWVARGADAAGASFLKDAVGRVYSETLAAEREHVQLEIHAPTPISPRTSALSMMHDAQFAAAPVPAICVDEVGDEIDESHIHPALRQSGGGGVAGAFAEREDEERFVTPPLPSVSGASSLYSTRPVSPA